MKNPSNKHIIEVRPSILKDNLEYRIKIDPITKPIIQ